MTQREPAQSDFSETRDIDENTNRKEKEGIPRWKQPSIVIKSIQRLKNTEDGLRNSVLGTISSPTLNISKKMTKQALLDRREQTRLFTALERGNNKDLTYIMQILKDDPKRYYFASDDPNRLPNKPDHRGYTPLYVACKNGNLSLIKILIEADANPYQNSEVSKSTKESILIVAARWSHSSVLEFLLGSKFDWPQRDLELAHKATSNLMIKEMLKKSFKVNTKSFLTRYFLSDGR